MATVIETLTRIWIELNFKFLAPCGNHKMICTVKIDRLTTKGGIQLQNMSLFWYFILINRKHIIPCSRSCFPFSSDPKRILKVTVIAIVSSILKRTFAVHKF